MDTSTGGILYVVSHASEPQRLRYGGKTQRSLKVRSYEHWADSRNRSRGAIGNWLQKHASEPDNVIFQVHSEHTTLDELNAAEIALIASLKSVGMGDLNLAPGGAGTATGRPHNPTPLRGERHPRSKLTWQKVSEIRELRQRVFIPAEKLASQYGLKNNWAIRNVLWNKTWYDPEFDPKNVIEYTNDYHTGEMGQHSRLTWDQVREMREAARWRFEPREELAKRYGVARGTISFVLANQTWIDPRYDPASLAPGPKRTRVLDWEKVREVRDYYRASGGMHKDVGHRFGLGRATTSLLLNNKTWVDEGYGAWLTGRLEER